MEKREIKNLEEELTEDEIFRMGEQILKKFANGKVHRHVGHGFAEYNAEWCYHWGLGKIGLRGGTEYKSLSMGEKINYKSSVRTNIPLNFIQIYDATLTWQEALKRRVNQTVFLKFKSNPRAEEVYKKGEWIESLKKLYQIV